VKILQDIVTGNDFLNRILIAQKIRAKIDKWACIKLKSFCIAKEAIIGVNSLQNGRKYLQAIYPIGDYYQNI
jgi:hypothetical protein